MYCMLTHGQVVVVIVLEDIVELSHVAVLPGELLLAASRSVVVVVVVMGMGQHHGTIMTVADATTKTTKTARSFRQSYVLSERKHTL